MLLCCIKDMYLNQGDVKIFTSGKTYRAVLGKYTENLTTEEIEAFNRISEDYPCVKSMLEWTVIKSINDLSQPWIVEIIENLENYNHANQFKNEYFVQISSFRQGL